MREEPTRTSVPSLDELERECERTGLSPEVLRNNPSFRARLMTALILKPLAEWFARAWQRFSDKQFCEIYSSFLRGSGDRGFVVKFPSSLLSSPDSLPAPLIRALVLSMGYEFERRTLRAETPSGTLLRKLAAWGTCSQEELARLQAAQRWRRYNPEGKKENSSRFILALWEKLAATAVPSVSSKEGLLEFLSGWLNDLPADADNRVRNEVETAQRRSRRVQPLQSQDLNVVFADDVDRQILLAEIRSLESLTRRERQVLELGLQDLTEEDIASRLDVTKPRVSQLRSSSIRKIRKEVGLS